MSHGVPRTTIHARARVRHSHGHGSKVLKVALFTLALPLLCGWGLTALGYQVHTSSIPSATESIDTETDISDSEHGYRWLCEANWGPHAYGAGRHLSSGKRATTYRECLAAVKAGRYNDRFSVYVWAGPLDRGMDCVETLAPTGDTVYCP